MTEPGEKRPGRDGIYVGIDVGGRPDKGFDLAALEWNAGLITSVRFVGCPHPVELPGTDKMRTLVAVGDYPALAKLTHDAAKVIAENLWTAIMKLSSEPVGVFVDSPSAFSRNQRGHGRLTEKHHLQGVAFQSTPSSCCGKEHRGTWAWLVYGIVAYVAVTHEGGSFTLPEWERLLTDGTFMVSQKLSLVVRECFPTATIAKLRASDRASEVEKLVKPLLSKHPVEMNAVIAYLKNGVWGTKKPGDRAYDRADALVAGLSSLPHARTDFSEQHVWATAPKKWIAAPGAQLIEGAVALVS